METKKIRLLRADEIECRVDAVYDSGITLLLYKDARVDQNILDEVFGVFGWERLHTMIGDAMFCTISIRDENGGWISKMDAGSPSFAEPLKGSASDSFKRAATNVGIGRELYTAPSIFVPVDKVEIKMENGKKKVKDRFYVSIIQYDEERRVITGVEIKNKKNEVVFTYGLKQKPAENNSKQKIKQYQKKEGNFITAEEEQALRILMKRKGVTEKMICNRYLIPDIQSMDDKTLERVIRALEATKDAAA